VGVLSAAGWHTQRRRIERTPSAHDWRLFLQCSAEGTMAFFNDQQLGALAIERMVFQLVGPNDEDLVRFRRISKTRKKWLAQATVVFQGQ